MPFHDGTPGNFHRVGNDIHFEVDIEYLAQMVHPEYHLFKGVLKNCQQLVLELVLLMRWNRAFCGCFSSEMLCSCELGNAL